MKLTKEQLKQIIKEELINLKETEDLPIGYNKGPEDEKRWVQTMVTPGGGVIPAEVSTMRWNHEFLPVILGAMQEVGIPSDVIRPSEVLKLAIRLIGGPEDAEKESVFRGDIKLARAVAKAGGQQQSAHDYGDDSE